MTLSHATSLSSHKRKEVSGCHDIFCSVNDIDMQVKFEPDWLSVITVSAAGPRPDGIRGSRGNSDHLLGTLHSKECLYVFLVHCCSVFLSIVVMFFLWLRHLLSSLTGLSQR